MKIPLPFHGFVRSRPHLSLAIVIGVAAGVLLALGLNQLLVSQLEMARLPPGYLLAGALVFWLLGVGAVYGPALRAASISPATATRRT